ncbi:ABC transporter permease [Motilibacter aurantiacus]|uniref:ABC transporter permease n=1 Tax=Motilibacter aurantiacus TaxID=2714955 RepID=UPI00140D3AED|nr:ABC transporter permease [Motilibacter aurantiacus]
MTAPTRPPAVLYDIRYSRFTGQLRPRVYAVLALARSSALGALGVRRSTGAKIWPFLLVVVAYAPAVVAVGIPLLVPDNDEFTEPLDFVSYYELLALIATPLLAYVATTIPSLLTRDRRDRVLTLYFSTALSAWEYVLGKVIAALLLILLVTLGPLLVLLVGGALVSDSPIDYVGDHAGDLPKVVLAGMLLALFHAGWGLAIGSLTPRRVFAVGGYLGVMLVASTLGGAVASISNSDAFLAFVLPIVPIDMTASFLDTPEGNVTAPQGLLWTVWLVVVLGAAAVLWRRYRGGRES